MGQSKACQQGDGEGRGKMSIPYFYYFHLLNEIAARDNMSRTNFPFVKYILYDIPNISYFHH